MVQNECECDCECDSLLANKVMKSNTIFHEEKLKSAFGLYPEQFKVLHDTLELFHSMDFTGVKKRFLEGAIMAIIVVFNVQKALKFETGIDHFLAYKLCQDFVERFFGEMRDMSTDRNPCALHLMYRMQRIITHKMTDVHLYLQNFEFFALKISFAFITAHEQ